MQLVLLATSDPNKTPQRIEPKVALKEDNVDHTALNSSLLPKKADSGETVADSIIAEGIRNYFLKKDR